MSYENMILPNNKPQLQIRCNFRPLVQGDDGTVRVGTSEGPQLLERYEAGNWITLKPLELRRPIDRQEMQHYVFSWSDKNNDTIVDCGEITQMAYGEALPAPADSREVLLGAEVVQGEGEFFLHTRVCSLPDWCNDKALPSQDADESHWQIAIQPLTYLPPSPRVIEAAYGEMHYEIADPTRHQKPTRPLPAY